MLQNCSIVAKKKREYFYLKINNILYVILLYSTSLPWKNVHFNFLMLLIQNYITWKQRIFSAHLKILVFLNRTSVELCLISSCPSHLVTWNFWECIHHKNFTSKSNKHYSKKHIHWKCLQALLLLLCFSLLQILCFADTMFFKKLNVCGNSVSSKSISTISNDIYSFIFTVSYFDNSLNISNLFLIVIFVMIVCDI